LALQRHGYINNNAIQRNSILMQSLLLILFYSTLQHFTALYEMCWRWAAQCGMIVAPSTDWRAGNDGLRA
jgi:hypothetical protein